MMEIILNEKAWAENAIESGSLGQRPAETLMRVAKYYHSMGYKRNEIERLLEEFLLRCDPTITLPRWRQAISRCASGAGKYPLIDVRGVTISQREMEQIGRLGGRLAQRLMFTLLCLAKYGNAVNPRNGNWVNRSPREVFALANITVTVNGSR